MTENLMKKDVTIVAHRGASFDAPENTMAAFDLAWRQGADAIEGDFRLTADGQIVCMHDPTLARTAGVERQVSESTLADLQRLDIGRWKRATYAGERIPTLTTILESLPMGKGMFIEIKSGTEIMPMFGQVLARHEARWPDLRVISFDQAVIAAVKRTMPGLKAYWLTAFKEDEHGTMRPTITDVLSILAETGADGVDAEANVQALDEDFVHALAAAGKASHVWTVDDAELARTMMHRGVSSITTNRPGQIREALGL